MGDLFDWALTAVQGRERWHSSEPLSWPEEKTRFLPVYLPSTTTWPPTLSCMLLPRLSFRAPSPTPSPTSVSSQCSVASPVPAHVEKISSSPESTLARSPINSLRQFSRSNESQFLSQEGQVSWRALFVTRELFAESFRKQAALPRAL